MNKSLKIGGILVTLIVLVICLGPSLTPYPENQVDMLHRLEGVSKAYPLGTDQMGRCFLTRLLYGGRVSIVASLIAVILTSSMGALLGLVAGYFGGKVDKCISWLCEVILAFPGILLALVLAGILGSGIFYLMIALAFTSWAGYARLTRNLVLKVKQMDYIKVAKMGGCKDYQVMLRHILPNVLSPLMTLALANIGGMILKLSGLSFIGLGSQPPSAEWGMMVQEGRLYLETAPQLMLYPILAICLTVLSFNLLGDGLRRYLNPRSEG